MSREHTGTITIKTLADGTRAFHLRFIDRGRRERVTLHERRGCTCGCGGGWNERTAAVELKNIVARVEAGVWQKIKPDKPQCQREMPTFHEYASAWLEAKIAGTIGDRPIDVNTQNDYRWRLSKHLLPFFAKYRLDTIDAATCQAFKAKKLAEAAELRAAIEAGADIRDKSGKVARPLGPASIRKLITTLAAILDEAIEDGHIERNPARGRRMRVRVPKPSRTFLEMDELVALIDAGGDQDSQIAHVSRARLADKGTSAAKVAELLAEGKSTTEIAAELGRAKSTIGWHIRRLGVEGTRDYIGRRAIIATLGGAGLRASELCNVLMAEVRLHDPDGARLRIPDAKTTPASAKCSSARTSSRSSSRTSTGCAALASRRIRARISSRIAGEVGSPASASRESSTRRPGWRPNGSSRMACRHSRSRRRTASGGRTSRSRCSRTSST
jgi:integrase